MPEPRQAGENDLGFDIRVGVAGCFGLIRDMSSERGTTEKAVVMVTVALSSNEMRSRALDFEAGTVTVAANVDVNAIPSMVN